MRTIILSTSIIFLVGCYSGKHLLKRHDSLIGKSLPRKVEKTFDGSLRSTQIFANADKDQALIFVVKDLTSLKKIRKPKVYAWRIIDVRFKSWYIPSFINNGKYSKYKSVVIGDKKSLIETLKIKRGNWVLKLNQGKITAIVPLTTYLKLPMLKESDPNSKVE